MNRTHLQTELRAKGFRLIDLALALGVDKATVSRWSLGRVPAERVLDVERVSGIGRHVIRPDLFAAQEASTPASAPQFNSEHLVNEEAA